MSHICVTCGTQYPNPNEPPRNCPICQDERQYVGPLGQKWIALPELQKTHRNVFFEEAKISGEFTPNRILPLGSGHCCCKRNKAGFSGTASA